MRNSRFVTRNSQFTLLFLSILALAFALRMFFPTLAEFKLDEATVVRRALAIAYERDLPAEGVGASVGTANLPFFLYLMAIPLRLWADPVAAVLFVGLLNGLAVWACYALGKAYFSSKAGLIAAYLFSVCPWAILYGRKIWTQNLPLITLGFITALLATFVKKRPWAFTAACVGLAALIGLHLGGLAFVPVLLLAMFLYRREIELQPLLVGVALAALAMLPYIINDALHGWHNLRGFLGYTGGPATFSLDALYYAFAITGSAGIEGQAGAFVNEYLARVLHLWWLNQVMMGLLAIALVYAVVQLIRGPEERRRVFVILLAWFIVPIAMQLRTSRATQPHYFILLYPVQFLLIGNLLADAWNWLSRSSRRQIPVAIVGLTLLLVWGGWQITVWANLLPMMIEHPTTGGYGIPLRHKREAAALVDATICPGEVIVLSTENNPAFEETPAVFDTLLFGRPHRFADETAFPVPDSMRVAYLVGPVSEDGGELAPTLQMLEETTGFHPGSQTTLAAGWTYRSFCRQHTDREDVLSGFTRFPADVLFANHVVFAGYRMPETVAVGDILSVKLIWWLHETPAPGTNFQFYTHLLDQDGRLVSQYDGNGYPTAYWQASDLVISRFPLNIPGDLAPGTYAVRAGIYSWPEIINIPVIDSQGNAVDDGVTVGKLEIKNDQ
ncbi:MAG: glycosyltransferase family 39 protein [Anaerolineae bacterium]|nr:glycosyltransferase family 39 protein [Anaerolineae bacterium]